MHFGCTAQKALMIRCSAASSHLATHLWVYDLSLIEIYEHTHVQWWLHWHLNCALQCLHLVLCISTDWFRTNCTFVVSFRSARCLIHSRHYAHIYWTLTTKDERTRFIYELTYFRFYTFISSISFIHIVHVHPIFFLSLSSFIIWCVPACCMPLKLKLFHWTMKDKFIYSKCSGWNEMRERFVWNDIGSHRFA